MTCESESEMMDSSSKYSVARECCGLLLGRSIVYSNYFLLPIKKPLIQQHIGKNGNKSAACFAGCGHKDFFTADKLFHVPLFCVQPIMSRLAQSKYRQSLKIGKLAPV